MRTSYILTLSVPAADLRVRLAEIPGAVFVRELPPDRVVVVLESPAGRPALSHLPGVAAVQDDLPRRLH
ncbi:hypothetical protein [Sphaerisporangium aureirubrum]|uniref:Uncharacterized protein n=1 Tax=Sphaerisporangium aureirubrum TaxID=1544736 RepID=A0ABW1NHZ8_9ACTN